MKAHAFVMAKFTESRLIELILNEHNMEIKNIITVLGTIICSVAAIGSIFFTGFVLFPFINGLTPEKRLEKFIDKKCLEGNEIAIRIRRQNMRYFNDSDCGLVRAAIEGNEHAIKALKLELSENRTQR